MIVDQLKNLSFYESNLLPITEVVEFLNKLDLDRVPLGRHEINKNAFMLVQEYETKVENLRPEWHEHYVDIQLVVSGNEIIEVGSFSDQFILDPYNDEKDIGFAKFKLPTQSLHLYEKDFAIIYPWELHAPCIRLNAERVKKIVIKIKWEGQHA